MLATLVVAEPDLTEDASSPASEALSDLPMTCQQVAGELVLSGSVSMRRRLTQNQSNSNHILAKSHFCTRFMLIGH